MASDPVYEASVSRALDRIHGRISPNLGDRFAEHSKITKGDIHPIIGTFPGLISAIDGSNAIIVESGSFALAAIRAAQSTFKNGERVSRSITPLRLVTIGQEPENEDFPQIMNECFGTFPTTPLKNTEPERTSSILRSTLEFGIANWQVKELPEKSLLLIDGTLRVSNQNHKPVLENIIKSAQDHNVLIAAVVKRTNATWQGGNPLLPATSALAALFGINGPWWMRIDEHLLDSSEYVWDRHGDLYVGSFHPSKNMPFKLEVPRGLNIENVEKIMQGLASCADDGRIPGYPYPLLDAHRTAVIDEPLIEQIRQDVMKGFSLRQMNKELFDTLFGDLHDEFERY